MLKNLYIKDYAIIDELNIEFNDGFNVFTGETGAGKSIIVGALSYLIQGKADPSVIRAGADKAIIEGVFSVDEYMKASLDDAGIDYDDEIIIRRVINRDGHNPIRINQAQVTLGFLSDLFDQHIDIHSQKDSQYLLNKKNHLSLLDRYSGTDELISTYRKDYEEYRRVFKEYEELKNTTYNEAELDFYRFDLKELEDAKIDPEEEEELLNKEKRYKSAERYLSALNSAIDLFEGEDGIDEKMSLMIRSLNLDDSQIDEVRSSLEDTYYGLQDQLKVLHRILNGFSEDDIDIDYLEERLYTYSKLKRKHDTDAQGLLKKSDELRQRVAFFEDKDFVLAQKQKELDAAYEKAYTQALALRKIRQEKAAELEDKIILECDDLMLNNTSFVIRFQDIPLSANGIDDVEFFISLNKGEELKALKNVASGGEISRLMLALKSVFARLSETSLLIFDEIDTGVSGKVASAIGAKMANIARDIQVLTITHLSAVAACARTHFYIYKAENSGMTTTLIRKLDQEEIIRELATISSADVTDSALKAAEELYRSSQDSLYG